MTFSAVMGIFNLLLRPYSCYVLYTDWLNRNELQPELKEEKHKEGITVTVSD